MASGSTVNYTGNVMSGFNFNTPAQLNASVTGSWPVGNELDGTDTTLTIAANGTFTGVALNCSFSGKLTPDSTHNFFNATVTLGAKPCYPPNEQFTGVAVNYFCTTCNTNELLIGAVSADNSTDIHLKAGARLLRFRVE